jgi:hypothetical protein
LKQGYDQVLWLLGEEDRVTEVGAMNFFLAVQREDGGPWFSFGFLAVLRLLYIDPSSE